MNSSNIITSILVLLLVLISSIGSSQSIDDNFFAQADAFFKNHVKNGLVDYGTLQDNSELDNLIIQIESADLSATNDNVLQAFYINAYNLHVINKIISNYPTPSVQNKAGFFDSSKIIVANESMTLNKLEKKKLLKAYNDPRYHFVLVCGALGCPPITDFAYTPDYLEEQLDRQTSKALNDPEFVRTGTDILELSQIFKWYARDFGSSKTNIISFINKYRIKQLPSDSKFKYYNYNWSLNDTANSQGSLKNPAGTNSSRYIVSSTIPKGTIELKIFNNLYSQQTGSNMQLTDRSSFFTTIISALYGLSYRFNIGINTRYRKVRNNALPSSPFSVFGGEDINSSKNSRSGLTALGPQIRWAPVPAWSNFSIQSSFVFAIGHDLKGNDTQPYIDWDGATWNTQIFNDFSIGYRFSLFTQMDFLIEDLGKIDKGNTNRVSTPVTAIFSYVPTTQLTVYILGGYSPYWQKDFDYFSQYGIGSKYQFTPNFELELLYTDFSNKSLNNSGGKAETINLGVRLNIN